MGDLITLNCPSCGGKLQIINTTTSLLNCIHCGSEHLVRRTGGAVTLESFARCPMCGRNDRVEKVSAIYNYKSGAPLLISRLKPPDILATQRLRSLPIPELELPDKPEPQEIPEKPQQKVSMIVLNLAFLIIPAGIFTAIFTSVLPEYKALGVILAILMAAVIAVIAEIPEDILAFIEIEKFRRKYDQHVIDLRDQNAADHQEWEKEVQERTENHQKEKEWILTKNTRREELKTLFERAYQRWEKLYYCHRDDSVFLPGEGTFVAVEQMKDFLLEN